MCHLYTRHPKSNIKITGLSELTPRRRMNYKEKCLRQIPMLSSFGEGRIQIFYIKMNTRVDKTIIFLDKCELTVRCTSSTCTLGY